MPTLYEIDGALLRLMEESVDPETGEFKPDQEAWDRLQMEREVKIENTALYIKDLRARAGDIAEEAKTLQARKKALENRADWLAENLRQSLDGTGFETARCVVKFKKNPESVRYTDQDAAMAWAAEYAQDCIRVPPPELSKAAIKAKLQQGEMVPGAELVREVRMEVK